LNFTRFYTSLLLLLITLASCHRALQPASLAYQHYNIAGQQRPDSLMMQLIRPYGDSVERSMSEVLGTTAATLEKKQPSGSLGNFMTDAVLAMAAKQFNTAVDFAIINYGGIRSTQLPKGAVTRGKVFELMPFDNLMVLQKLSAQQVQQLFDFIAAHGGWPIAGASFTIRDKKATDILIGGKPLEQNKIYTLANSDYVANGGDNAGFLKSIPQINSGYLIRDALIAYVRSLKTPIAENVENRIRHAE
jgi:2',3'-cyclic-nucleotide 2'-phosphodiesterase (5'-nucleotidase family)